MRLRLAGWLAVLCAVSFCPAAGGRQSGPSPLDPERSRFTIFVSKSGVFSAFGHDHTIEARIVEGKLSRGGSPSVMLRVDSRGLRVLDADLSPDKRAEVQQTMLGPEVLDAARFPEIRFQSTRIEPAGAGRWSVSGDLTLHGVTKPVAANVTWQDGVYRGTARLKQRDFGIQPVSAAGGTVRVKDEVKLDFEIYVLQPPS